MSDPTHQLSPQGQLLWVRDILGRGIGLRIAAGGHSMHPVIRHHDVLTLAPLGNHKPRVGDVLAFCDTLSGRLRIHRVIETLPQGCRLRGDNGSKDDGVIPPKHLLGIVTRVERNGRRLLLPVGFVGPWIARLNRGRSLQRLKHLPRRLRLCRPGRCRPGALT